MLLFLKAGGGGSPERDSGSSSTSPISFSRPIKPDYLSWTSGYSDYEQVNENDKEIERVVEI